MRLYIASALIENLIEAGVLMPGPGVEDKLTNDKDA